MKIIQKSINNLYFLINDLLLQWIESFQRWWAQFISVLCNTWKIRKNDSNLKMKKVSINWILLLNIAVILTFFYGKWFQIGGIEFRTFPQRIEVCFDLKNDKKLIIQPDY